MDEYITLADVGTSRYEDRKSIFLGFAKSVTTEAEAVAYINEIKSRYPDARHHVYAYSLRESFCTRYSDDHEPQGSAGMPVLDVLRRGQIVDACIVVVRYFGGTLLGTGGLVHAYGTSAADAVASAGKLLYRPSVSFEIVCNYSDYQKLLPILSSYDVAVGQTDFGTDVGVHGTISSEKVEQMRVAVENATAGRALLEETGRGFFSIRI